MRILIVAAQPHLRTALQYLLSQQNDVDLVGVVGGGPGLASKIAVAAPEVLVLDWELPEHAAARLLAVGRRLPNRPRTVVLGDQEDARRDALAAGADAFVHWGDEPDTLLDVLRSFKASERDEPDDQASASSTTAPS